MTGAPHPTADGAVAAAVRDLAEAARDAAGERASDLARIEAELALGRRLQRSFVPLVAPDVPGWELASHYEAAREVGGDFFDVFVPLRAPGRLALVVADVTGKGIAAALLMAFARPLLHAAIDHTRRPGTALERTNRVLVEERRAALFITALCVILDTRSRRVTLANAGHEPPLVVRGATGAVEEIDGSGPLLGAFPSLDLPEVSAHLAPGDLLLLYTDGVTDARGPSGERFGDDRLREVVAAARGSSPRDLVEAVVRATARFQGAMLAADDVTMLAIRARDRAGQGSRRASPRIARLEDGSPQGPSRSS